MFSAVPRASCPVFMFYASGLNFGSDRGRPISFSWFSPPDLSSTIPRASGTVFLFCTAGLIFGATEGVRSRFHVSRARTHFRRYRWRRVPFSCIARPYSFSTVPKASPPVFIFCASGFIFLAVPMASCTVFIFDGTGGVGSRFHVLRSRTRFWRYRGRRDPFSTFALPDSFFDGTEGVGSRFHVLRSRTCFRQYRGCRVPFSCFVLPDSFSAVPRASDLVFMLRAPELISLAAPRASGTIFMFCPPGIIFDGTEGVPCRFQFFRSETRFRRKRGRRVPFSSFALPEMSSASRARTRFRRY
jgi:hypothetical protein